MRTAPLSVLALMATACGPAAVPERRTAPPAFLPMTEADIRRTAIACLQRPPYPIDGGPLCLRRDGSSISYSGWGNALGRYRIAGHRIILGEGNEFMDRDLDAIAFFRSRDDRMFVRYEQRGGDPRLHAFTPYAEADYLRSLGPPVPPPG